MEHIQSIDVCFRKFPEGDVIAIFPQIEERYGMFESYQHFGQHGPCSKELLCELKTATPAEYKELLCELKMFYPNLKVVRHPHNGAH